MIKAIIFDFDGVLANTWKTSIDICRALNLDFTIDDFKDHHNGNVFENPKIKPSKQQADDFLVAYEKQVSASKLFPLGEELKKLSQEYKMFVISSSDEKAINKYLGLGKWDHYFAKILGMRTDKSKIKKFNILFQDYGLLPEECIFVTDTLGDLIEGEKAGVKTLAVTWGYHGETRLKKGQPHKIIHNFNELLTTIARMNP